MKRIVIPAILVLIAATVFGDPVTVYEPAFKPQSPEIMAQGGSFTANAKGFNSLYTNPAGFSAGKSSLTIVAVNPWLYMFPDQATIDATSKIASDPTSSIAALNDLLTSSGVGLGAQLGLGFVGGGFGIGAIVMNDTFAYGPNTLGVQVDTGFTAAVIAGVSFPIHLGSITLTPGGDLRPMYRIRAYDMGISNFLGFVSGGDASQITADVLAGMGLGIDLGLDAKWGPLTVAVAVRDFGGTQFQFGALSFADAMNALQSGSLPQGDPIPSDAYKFVIPMSIHTGVQFHPDLGGFAFLFDPTVHAEYVMTQGSENASFWTNLHLGAEVRVLRLLRLRAGLNQGYATMGVGVKLLFLEAHVAYFGRELGKYPGARENQGVTAEVALRF